MRRLKPAVSALVIALLLVTAFDYAASAATGKPFLLGKLNKASHTSAVQNTGKGAALQLKNKPAYPPLMVNSTKKVSKLNVDQVDGKSASDLGVRTGVVNLAGFAGSGATPTEQFQFSLGGPGYYLVSLSTIMSATNSPGNFTTCWLTQDVTFKNFAYSSAPQVDAIIKGMNATVVLDANHDYVLRCAATGAWTLQPGSQLSVTRITDATTG